jgi:hypothetical protein
VTVAMLAQHGFAQAPTIQSLEGETLQILDGTTIAGSKSPPISVERAWVAQYTNLEKIDKNNRVLANKGVNMDLAEILYRLAKCENGLRPSGGIIDTNGLESNGLYMFQEKTFYRFGDGNWKDPKDQTKVAIEMIMLGIGETSGGWLNCWRIESLPII